MIMAAHTVAIVIGLFVMGELGVLWDSVHDVVKGRSAARAAQVVSAERQEPAVWWWRLPAWLEEQEAHRAAALKLVEGEEGPAEMAPAPAGREEEVSSTAAGH